MITKLGKLLALLILAANGLFTGMLLLVAYSPHIDPTEHPMASCLGLTFPLFVVANICFLLFWVLIRCYRWALLPLAGLLLCSWQIRTYLPVNSRSKQVPERSFKLLSYNIMGFAGAKKEEGRNPILEYLKGSDADIICLQEYQTIESPRRLRQQDVEQALKAYPYHRVNKVGSEKSNKLACYSKFPILSARVLEYESGYNGSVMYELKVRDDTLLLINNHLESNKLTLKDREVYEEMLRSPEKEKVKSGSKLLIHKLAEASAIRAPQADSIAKAISRSSHRMIIACGDFNDTPISYVHRVVAQELDDAFTHAGNGLGISYNQHKFYFRIDHILASKSLQAFNCTVDHSIRDSDHYPIWCQLAAKEATGP